MSSPDPGAVDIVRKVDDLFKLLLVNGFFLIKEHDNVTCAERQPCEEHIFVVLRLDLCDW